jgi:type VI secretion system secreted protein VgrG
MVFTQEHRLLSFTTPLGPDVLLLQALQGHEGISTLFRFDLELLAEDDAIPFDKLVGQNVTIRLALAEDHERYINGFVSRFAQGRSDVRFTHYHAEVVPWLWFLTRTADSRIFQDMSVPEIIKNIFHKHGFSDIHEALTRTYTPWDYCVQYRETDFNFVSRLMEQEGIFYFFEHERGKHTLVLADAPEAHRPCPDQSRARYWPEGGMGEWEGTVTSWRMEQELRSGRYSLRDYHDQMPNKALEVTEPTSITVGRNGRFEIYHYPGAYAPLFNEPDQRLGAVEPEGRRLVKLRMQEEESSHLVISGASFCRAFSAGQRFELTHHSRRDANGPYVLTAVQQTAVQTPDYVSGSDIDEPYHNSFTCIPHRVPFRPPRRTPKPIMHTQTAIVVGKAGEEIWVDKYGRVKVQFHWDRQGEANEHSSCWIRVAQNWAGKRWGAMFIPRIGQEVIVDFLEGDPDQPIITGRVYNAEQMSPYELPGEQTKSTLKSLSSKGGGGFNEIRFEDKKGQEQIFVHAEKNQDIRVKTDALEWIGRDRHLIVKHDQLEMVEGDKHLQVTGDHHEKVDGTVSLKVGMDLQEKVGMKHALDAGMEIHLKAGMNVVIEAGMSITLKAGGGFIVVGPAGVTVSGTPILLNSGGAAGSGSGSSPETPSAPKEADTASPGERTDVTTSTATVAPPRGTSATLSAGTGPAASGTVRGPIL